MTAFRGSDSPVRAARAVVLRRAAAVLVTLVPEIAPVARGVRDVPGPGVVHDGLADLGETRHEPVHEHQDEEKPRDAQILAMRPGEANGEARAGFGRTRRGPARTIRKRGGDPECGTEHISVIRTA